MLSKRYIYKSDQLRDRYIEGAIDYKEYMSSLETIKNEEVSSLNFSYEKKARSEQIYDFEDQQFDWAKKTIRKNEEIKKAAILKEKEAAEQKKLGWQTWDEESLLKIC